MSWEKFVMSITKFSLTLRKRIRSKIILLAQCPLIFFPNDGVSILFKASYSFSGIVEVWHNNFWFLFSRIRHKCMAPGKDLCCLFFFFFPKVKTCTYIHPLLSYWQHLSLSYKTYLTYNGATLLLKPIGPFMKNKDKYESDLPGLVAKQAV